jgi:hypothetical protein
MYRKVIRYPARGIGGLAVANKINAGLGYYPAKAWQRVKGRG